jgi:hypothetical protein
MVDQLCGKCKTYHKDDDDDIRVIEKCECGNQYFPLMGRWVYARRKTDNKN